MWRINLLVIWFLARVLVTLRLDVLAEPLLRKISDELATAKMLWLHATVLRRLHAAPEAQLRGWERLLERTPDKRYMGKAWRAIGNLLAELPWNEAPGAITAYQRAEAAGEKIPALRAYRAGDWETLPFLRTHPDYAYPVVVTVDLEVDPELNAKPGERVFEVGAVRAKGRSILDEYTQFIQRDWVPRKGISKEDRQRARPQREVAAQLRSFIGEAFVAGHNLRDFDAKHLRGIGVPIRAEQLVDTLHIARLLYPDSQYHNLGILCHTHNIPLDTGERHTALPDARACAKLIHALGDALLQREDALIVGLRSLAQPKSSFDRVLLQPRGIPADPLLQWSLDPTPVRPRAIVALRNEMASSAMAAAIRQGRDALVQLQDRNGGYVRDLSSEKRTLVAVATRLRLERMLASGAQDSATYVLPDRRTLLCPERMRAMIDATDSNDQRLLLFCLYQASHNHDAATLYPLRLPPTVDDPAVLQVQHLLRQTCCIDDISHRATCAGVAAMHTAIAQYPLLFSTHTALFHLSEAPTGDLIVVDDIAELEMQLPEHLADEVGSEQVGAVALGAAGESILTRLNGQIAACIRDCLPRPAFHERLPLSILAPYLTKPEAGERFSLLDALEQFNASGAALSEKLRALFKAAEQEPASPSHTHAFWLELWLAEDQEGYSIEKWMVRGLSANLIDAFQARCWQPFRQHVICGPALLPGPIGSTFLERSLGVAVGLPYTRDIQHERPQVLLPMPEVLSPPGMLSQRKWAMDAGALLYMRARSDAHTIAVTLTPMLVSDALAAASRATAPTHGRKVLGRTFGWSTTQMTERLENSQEQVLAFVSPRARRAALDLPVDIEISGPLRFLNTRDPLVASRMRVFASLYAAEGPFDSYLLPQALLELSARLSSSAGTHLLLDSRIMTRRYRDEALHALSDIADIRFIQQPPPDSPEAVAFLERLGHELDARGLTDRQDVSDEDLHLVLRSLWGVGEFRQYERGQGRSASLVSQKDVVRGVIEGRDQLLVIPTGGGKSLCFQLPAVLFAEDSPPKVTLVFSPLIALMANQVDALNRKGIFSAVLINSTLSPAQRQERLRGIRRGDYSIIYLAPEQIHSSGLQRALAEREVALVAMDEAHCLSQWGHDFRTDYFMIKRWMEQHLSHNRRRGFPILALTATARQAYVDPDDDRSDRASTVQDIIDKLHLNIRPEDAIIAPTQRLELEFRVERVQPQPLQCFKCGAPIEAHAGEAKCGACGTRRDVPIADIREAVDKAKRQRLFALLENSGPWGLQVRLRPTTGMSERGLVYCAYRRTTETLAAELQRRFPNLRIRAYHAGMDAEDREAVLAAFTREGEGSLDIVVATNAFGMGIDVRRLGFVVHFDAPGTLEAYYQEAGRAGRNSGNETTFSPEHKAHCLLLFHPIDLEKQRHLSRQHIITDHQIRDVYSALQELHQQTRESQNEVVDDYTIQNTVEMPDAGRYEVVATERDIAARAGVDEEDVGKILYYLEYHSTVNGRPVLMRGENANRTWRLKWEASTQSSFV